MTWLHWIYIRYHTDGCIELYMIMVLPGKGEAVITRTISLTLAHKSVPNGNFSLLGFAGKRYLGAWLVRFEVFIEMELIKIELTSERTGCHIEC